MKSIDFAATDTNWMTHFPKEDIILVQGLRFGASKTERGLHFFPLARRDKNVEISAKALEEFCNELNPVIKKYFKIKIHINPLQ